jgi:hypothetical protein
MDTLTDKMGDILEKLGQAFLVAGYLPAVLFVVAHQLYLLPHWLGHSITLLQVGQAEATAEVGFQWVYLVDQGLTLLLLPLLLGVLLMALNTIVIKLYEGAFGWQQRFLLRPWQQKNQKRAEALYGELVKLKADYTGTLSDLASLSEGKDPYQLEQKRISIAMEMQREHDEIATKSPVQRLPRRPSLVKPTALGNAFAVTEEYPYERYGMDVIRHNPEQYQNGARPAAQPLAVGPGFWIGSGDNRRLEQAGLGVDRSGDRCVDPVLRLLSRCGQHRLQPG